MDRCHGDCGSADRNTDVVQARGDVTGSIEAGNRRGLMPARVATEAGFPSPWFLTLPATSMLVRALALQELVKLVRIRPGRPTAGTSRCTYRTSG
jgi:hypothetical protein